MAPAGVADAAQQEDESEYRDRDAPGASRGAANLRRHGGHAREGHSAARFS